MVASGRLLAVVLLGGVLAISGASSQQVEGALPRDEGQQSEEEGRFPVADIVTMLAPVLLPKFVADTYRLREFITTEEFAGIRSTRGDPAAVDAIFVRARELSWGNVYEALLISAFATFDHRRVGVDPPVLGPLLWFPLTSEFEEDFQVRLKALPSRLYEDTPAGPAGDRDKLQHFFGSAFVAAASESREAAVRVGDFVEWGEERFIVGGVNDERDVRANQQGQEFGLRILTDGGARPSQFLRGGNVAHLSIDAAPCPRGAVAHAAGARMEER
jgi:hypothetical protein